MTDMERLAGFLAGGRSRKGMTLRAAEAATGVSNAYLSQLESGKVKNPSPVILKKLCDAYGISYRTALECAGYPVPGAVQDQPISGLAARLGPVSREEEEALIDYLGYLRSKNKRGGRQ